MSRDTRIYATVAPVLRVLESLNIRHYVCGSVASSIHGEPRTTIDIDLVADLSPAEAAELAGQLQPMFYADADAIRNAVIQRRSFNLIHLTNGLKVDVFPVKDRDYDYAALERVEHKPVEPQRLETRVPVSSPEDVVLAKLEWYRLGDGVSDRQWLDLVKVLRARRSTLDQDYLDRWALRLEVADLLRRAQREAQNPGS